MLHWPIVLRLFFNGWTLSVFAAATATSACTTLAVLTACRTSAAAQFFGHCRCHLLQFRFVQHPVFVDIECHGVVQKLLYGWRATGTACTWRTSLPGTSLPGTTSSTGTTLAWRVAFTRTTSLAAARTSFPVTVHFVAGQISVTIPVEFLKGARCVLNLPSGNAVM